MKVSKKVARRSRKHTSLVSRRRLRNNKNKSGYRKKNAKTQKGGKRGRGQKRVHVHTHKRGKRFHRGGADFNCDELVWITKTDKSIDATLGYFEAELSDQFTLFVIKKGSLTFNPDPQVFKVKLRILRSPSRTWNYCSSDLLIRSDETYGSFITRPYPLLFAVYLERVDSEKKPVNFHITRLGTFTDKKLLKKLARIDSGTAIYDFSSDKNDVLFKAIQSCVKNKLKEVYIHLLSLLNSFELDSKTFSANVVQIPYTMLFVKSTDSSKTYDLKTLLSSVEGYRDPKYLSDSYNSVTPNISKLKKLCNSIIQLLSLDYLTPENFQLLEDSLEAFSLIYNNITNDTTTEYWERAFGQRYAPRNTSYVKMPPTPALSPPPPAAAAAAQKPNVISAAPVDDAEANAAAAAARVDDAAAAAAAEANAANVSALPNAAAAGLVHDEAPGVIADD